MTLASIQKIEEINPIPNADAIEVAKILGWNVVVKKGEFKPGDLCIYIEIDTLIPNTKWSKFLFKAGHENDEYTRLRTIKLRGQISQGLIISLYTINSIRDYDIDENTRAINILDGTGEWKVIDLGYDVTDILAVRKFEKQIPVELQGIVKRYFPEFLRKTDEIRIQSEPELLEQLYGKSYVITQKMDGTSSTYYKYNGEFGVCSRNMELEEGDSIYWKMARKYRIKEWLPDGYAIQGEICGPGIQGNKMGLEENELFIFNAWDIRKQIYVNPEFLFGMLIGLSDVAIDSFENLRTVPTIVSGNLFDMTQEELLRLADDYFYENGSPQEGIVVRSLDQTISFKVISNKFLLKHGE